jgi:hypothetical protein
MNIVKAEKQSELYGIAIELLCSHYDIKNRGEQYWTKRFKNSELSHIGYLLKIDNKYVGFIGVIGSKITIGLSVWFVKTRYRKYSLSFLLNTIDDIGNIKIINSSPNPTALKVFKRIKGFDFNNEFVGLPKKIFGYSKISSEYLYKGNKFNVIYDKNVSLIDLIINSIKYKKICLGLFRNTNRMFLSKKINVLFKNINYKFPLSIYGDIYE